MILGQSLGVPTHLFVISIIARYKDLNDYWTYFYQHNHTVFNLLSQGKIISMNSKEFAEYAYFLAKVSNFDEVSEDVSMHCSELYV